MIKKFTAAYLLCTFVLLGIDNLLADVPAFPGAEGYGKYTTGGRGGAVYEVTNLNSSGSGSFAAAIGASGPRTVVFRVSGTITGNFSINNDDITIAGQTAPGDGICIRGNLSTRANNIIIRYIRVRYDPAMGENDGIGGRYQKNIIFDHVSASWSTDETMSLYHNENTTVQWCIIAQACPKGTTDEHRFGGIWGNDYGTWHHNLIAHNASRNPRWASGVGYNDYRNNVIYNWEYQNCYGGEASQPGMSQYSFSTINMIGNYYKPGPATKSSVRYQIAEPSARSSDDKGSWFVSGNYVDGSPVVTADNWQGMTGSNYIALSSPWNSMEISCEQSSQDAYQSVLADAGCSFPKRDKVDVDIIDDVINGTARYGNNGIIDSPDDVGGWPTLTSGTPPRDSDHDGMADDWEISNGLSPANAADRNDNTLSSDFTNLEVYFNSIIDTEDTTAPEPDPMEWEILPTAVGDNTITMTAVTATDISGVEYYFSNMTDPSHNSGWQSSTTYIDRGLLPETSYSYRVVARDTSFNLNETSPSLDSSATTLSEQEIDDLTAYWPFEETSGVIVHDVSGTHALIGTLQGTPFPSWTKGKYGNCISFGDLSQSIYFPSSPMIDFGTESFSVSIWAKQPISYDGQYELFIKGSISSPGTGKRYELYRKNSEFRFAVDDNVTKSQISVPISGICTDDWEHIIAVRNMNAGQLELYIGGSLAGTVADNTGNISQGEPLYVADAMGFGAVDDLRIYPYALDSNEVKDIYNGAGIMPYTCLELIDYDLDGNCQVNMDDFAIFAGEWLNSNYILDLQQLEIGWLTCNREPYYECW